MRAMSSISSSSMIMMINPTRERAHFCCVCFTSRVRDCASNFFCGIFVAFAFFFRAENSTKHTKSTRTKNKNSTVVLRGIFYNNKTAANMGSGKKKKKKSAIHKNNISNNTPQSAARTSNVAAAVAETPETPKVLIEDHFALEEKIQNKVVVTNSPFPSPILSPTPTPAKKVFPKSTLHETRSNASISSEADEEEEKERAQGKKTLNFVQETLLAEDTTTRTTEVTSPSPSQASVGTKIEKIESIIAAAPENSTMQSQTTQTTTQASTTLLLETNRDLRSALADSVSELASLEEENERLRAQIRKEIDIERPKLIAEACEDLSERLQRAEVAIERERREAASGKRALTELQATKQKLADALKLVEENRDVQKNVSEEKQIENEEQKTMETDRIRVMKDALEKAEDKVLVMFADLNATKVELNRLREENTELKTKCALSETKLNDMLNEKEQEKMTNTKRDSSDAHAKEEEEEEEEQQQHHHHQQQQVMMSPRAVKEELELASLMKKNAEMRDRESHKKMEEAERQKEHAVKVVEKLRSENEEIRRENEKLRQSLVEQDISNRNDTGVDVELASNDKVHSSAERVEKADEETTTTKKVVAKKRERPSVLRLPSFAWYFISGSDKAPEFVTEEDVRNF